MVQQPAACKALCLSADITSAPRAANMLLAQGLPGICSVQQAQIWPLKLCQERKFCSRSHR